MNKKSLTFNELLGLIIAAVLFFFLIIYPGSNLYASFTKQEYINSYNKLVDLIENSDLKEESTDLMMDFGTAIIAFPKESKEINFKKTSGGVVGSAGRVSETPESIPKPTICEDKACICLCKDFKRESPNYKFVCKKTNCNSLDDLDFFDMKNMRTNKIDSSSIYAVGGGIIITRVDKEVKSRAIYIKKNDKIAICLEYPCIEEK